MVSLFLGSLRRRAGSRRAASSGEPGLTSPAETRSDSRAGGAMDGGVNEQGQLQSYVHGWKMDGPRAGSGAAAATGSTSSHRRGPSRGASRTVRSLFLRRSAQPLEDTVAEFATSTTTSQLGSAGGTDKSPVRSRVFARSPSVVASGLPQTLMASPVKRARDAMSRRQKSRQASEAVEDAWRHEEAVATIVEPSQSRPSSRVPLQRPAAAVSSLEMASVADAIRWPRRGDEGRDASSEPRLHPGDGKNGDGERQYRPAAAVAAGAEDRQGRAPSRGSAAASAAAATHPAEVQRQHAAVGLSQDGRGTPYLFLRRSSSRSRRDGQEGSSSSHSSVDGGGAAVATKKVAGSGSSSSSSSSIEEDRLRTWQFPSQPAPPLASPSWSCGGGSAWVAVHPLDHDGGVKDLSFAAAAVARRSGGDGAAAGAASAPAAAGCAAVAAAKSENRGGVDASRAAAASVAAQGSAAAAPGRGGTSSQLLLLASFPRPPPSLAGGGTGGAQAAAAATAAGQQADAGQQQQQQQEEGDEARSRLAAAPPAHALHLVHPPSPRQPASSWSPSSPPPPHHHHHHHHHHRRPSPTSPSPQRPSLAISTERRPPQRTGGTHRPSPSLPAASLDRRLSSSSWTPPPQHPPPLPPHPQQRRPPSASSSTNLALSPRQRLSSFGRPSTSDSPPKTASSGRTFGPGTVFNTGTDFASTTVTDHRSSIASGSVILFNREESPPRPSSSEPAGLLADTFSAQGLSFWSPSSSFDRASLGLQADSRSSPPSGPSQTPPGLGLADRPNSSPSPFWAERSYSPGLPYHPSLTAGHQSTSRPHRYRQLETGQDGQPRLPSALQAQRLFAVSDELEQSPSRRRPSRIPTDIHDPHPFGVWISERRGPTSLPPPPRSLPNSLSRKRGEQLARTTSQSAVPLAPSPIDPDREPDRQEHASTSFQPALAGDPVAFDRRGDLVWDLHPRVTPAGHREQQQQQQQRDPHRRSPSDQSATSFATDGRASLRTNRLSTGSSSQPSASIHAPSLLSYNAPGASWSVILGSRSPSTTVTTPSLGAGSRFKHSHRSSGGNVSSRHHSASSSLDFAPPQPLPSSLSQQQQSPPPQPSTSWFSAYPLRPFLLGESLTPHREEPSSGSGSGSSPTATGSGSQRHTVLSHSRSLRKRGSTLSSLFRLGRRDRSDTSASTYRPDRAASASEADDTLSRRGSTSAHTDTLGTLDSAIGSLRGRGNAAAYLPPPPTRPRSPASPRRRFFQGSTGIRLRRSFAQLRPLLTQRAQRSGSGSQHSAPPVEQVAPAEPTNVFVVGQQSRAPTSSLTGGANVSFALPRDPPSDFPQPGSSRQRLPNVFSRASRPGQGGLRVQDLSEAGFPLLLPATPGSEAGLSTYSVVRSSGGEDESSGSRPSTGGGGRSQQPLVQSSSHQGHAAGTASTIKRRGGERLAAALRGEPTDPELESILMSRSATDASAAHNMEPAGEAAIQGSEDISHQPPGSLQLDAKADDRPNADEVTGRGPPRASSDEYAPKPADVDAAPTVPSRPSYNGSVAFPVRQRTDSRPATTPPAAMLAAAAAANKGLMPGSGQMGPTQPLQDGEGSSNSAQDDKLAVSAGQRATGEAPEVHPPPPGQQDGQIPLSPSRAVGDGSRQSVRRGLGMRAESESAYNKPSSRLLSSNSKHQQGRSKDDADGLAEERRADILQGKHSRGNSIATSIRRLIRRTSMRGKSQSISSLPPSMSPTRSYKGLHPDLETEQSRPSFGDFGEPTDSTLTAASSGRTRKESLARTKSGKDSRDGKASSSSIFAPFRASRDGGGGGGGKARARASSGLGGGQGPMWKRDRHQDGDESFGNAGPLESPAGLPKASRELPFSFRQGAAPEGEESDVAGLFTHPRPAPAVNASVLQEASRAGAAAAAPPRTTSMPFGAIGNVHSVGGRDSIEQLDSTPKQAVQELDASPTRDRPISELTMTTDDGMGVALGGRSATDLSDSLAINGLAASTRQAANASGSEAARSGSGRFQSDSLGSTIGGVGTASSTLSGKPRVGIPRIWQGIEPVDAPASPARIAAAGDDEGSQAARPRAQTASSDGLAAASSRFDTATTVSSFKTAESTLGSPRASQMYGARSSSSRPSLPSLDIGSRPSTRGRGGFESPLSDLITSLESRFDGRSSATSAAYFDAHSDSTESVASRDLRPAIAAGPSSSVSPSPEPGTVPSLSASTSIDRMPKFAQSEAADHGSLRAESVTNSTPTEAVPEARSTDGPAVGDDGDGEEHDDDRRHTFGGLDSLMSRRAPLLAAEASAETSPSLRDLDVVEIENHLAAVEAALQSHYADQSVLSTADQSFGPDPAAEYSMLADDGSFSRRHAPAASEGDVSMPGAWSGATSGAPRPFPSDENRLSLAPGSQQAIADAVRQVRRAISSSHLQKHDISRADVTAGGADETTAATADDSSDGDGLDSADEEEARDRVAQLAGDTTARSEVTPVRAAKRRRDSMRDIEESYGRMLALVQSSAIGVTPSPILKTDAGRFDRTPHRRSKRDPLSQSLMQQGQEESPLSRPTAQAAERRERTKSTPVGRLSQSGIGQPLVPPATRALGARFMGQRARGHSRINSSGVEVPASTSLSGLMGMPKDEASLQLRGRTSSSSFGSLRRVASESPVRLPRIDSPSLIENREAKRLSSGARAPIGAQQQSSFALPAQLSSAATFVAPADVPSRDRPAAATSTGRRDADHHHQAQAKRHSQEPAITGRASSGAGGTSPSATAKTLGTPRSQLADPAHFDDGVAGGGKRRSFPRATEASALMQAAVEGRHLSERERLGGSSSSAAPFTADDGHHDRNSSAHHARSPTFESRPSSMSHHTGDTSRSIEGHRRRNSRPSHPGAQHAAASSAAATAVAAHQARLADAAMSPAQSLASAARGRYEIGSIRDWSSQVSYRPASSRSSAVHAVIPQREDSSSTMGASEYGALMALGVMPSATASQQQQQAAIATLIRRHELERESLLDSLERTRAEVIELRTRNEGLTLDLHAEVTRVLELERELDQRDDREQQLLARTQHLERELARVAASPEQRDARQQPTVDADRAFPHTRTADDPPTSSSNGTSQPTTSSDHSQGGDGPHKVSSFGARPGHRSTHSETVLPASLKSPALVSDREVGGASASTLPSGLRPAAQERARPVSLFSGPSGLARVSPALRNDKSLGGSSAAQAATTSEQHMRSAAGRGSTTAGAKDRSPNLRQYPSLLGLNLNEDEADWALADEPPPEETSRDSLDDSRDIADDDDEEEEESTAAGGHPNHSQGDISSFIANYADTVPESRSVEFPTMSSPRRTPARSVNKSLPAPPSKLSGGREGEAGQPSAAAPPASAAPRDDRSRSTTSSSAAGNGAGTGVALPTRSSSILRSPSASATSSASNSVSAARGHKRVPGSLGLPSSSSGLPRLAGARSPSHRTVSSTSSIRSTASSRLQQPGSLSGIPFGFGAAAAGSGPASTPTGAANRQASSATVKSNYTHASTYTARSDSPVGSFVSNWRNLGSSSFSPERERTSGSGGGGGGGMPSSSSSAAIPASGTTSTVSTLKGDSGSAGEGKRGSTSGGGAKRSWIAGYYDPRRPGGYDPHSLSDAHEALLDTSFSSVDDEVREAREAAAAELELQQQQQRQPPAGTSAGSMSSRKWDGGEKGHRRRLPL